MELLVTFVFQTSTKSEFDRLLNIRVDAKNDAAA
jgi:hypothetical protein